MVFARGVRADYAVSPSTYQLLDAIADSFNPLFTIVALAVPWVRRPRTFRTIAVYYLAAGAAIGVVYLVRAVDAHQQLWASIGLDYSTHSAFAASLTVSISAFMRRWMAFLVIALVAYFCVQLVMRYHGVWDILTSATLAAAVALLLQLSGRKLE